MSQRNWNDLCAGAFATQKFLCVGLDPDYSKIPKRFKKNNPAGDTLDFCTWVIDQVGDTAGFIKPNWAFFLQLGIPGVTVLKQVIKYANEKFPSLAVILDCKVGDIGNTNIAYAHTLFDDLGADAITIHPYLGQQANQPFLDYADKGIFVLCHTSNPGAEEFQHMIADGASLHQQVASKVAGSWNGRGNCGLVTGATYPNEIKMIRLRASDVPLLVPGIGKQGGDLQAAVNAAKDANGAGFIINSSSGIIFADDPRAAAQQLHGELLEAL